MKVLVFGALGAMGQETVRLLQKDGSLAASVDKNYPKDENGQWRQLPDQRLDADVIIDFSHHSSIFSLAPYALRYALPVVIASTGQNEEELDEIRRLSRRVPTLLSANMSPGAAKFVGLVKTASALFENADIEITEKHHRRKLDAPSGTALTLLHEIQKVRPQAQPVFGRNGKQQRREGEIGVHAVRAGGYIGIHEVLFADEYETFTLRHETLSREVFAEGAIRAAAWLCRKPVGLYGLEDLIEETRR